MRKNISLTILLLSLTLIGGCNGDVGQVSCEDLRKEEKMWEDTLERADTKRGMEIAIQNLDEVRKASRDKGCA